MAVKAGCQVALQPPGRALEEVPAGRAPGKLVKVTSQVKDSWGVGVETLTVTPPRLGSVASAAAKAVGEASKAMGGVVHP